MKNRDLWSRIQAFEFDLPEAGFSFSRRLATENGWSGGFTKRVLEEYRRFLYLCVEAGHQVTPSDAVDQAWHLHLCYTRSYWEDLCGDSLGRKIHHGPTKGGSRERSKFSDWYGRTLESYQREFGSAPPLEIWPEASVRFAPRKFRRVDISECLVVSKRKLLLGLGVVGTALALPGCTVEKDAAIGIFLFLAILGILYLIIKSGGKGGGGGGGGCSGGWAGWSGSHRSDDSGSGDSGCGGSGCGSGCGGGCGS